MIEIGTNLSNAIQGFSVCSMFAIVAVCLTYVYVFLVERCAE